jgi:membrane-associated phospholipid phosphatase
MKFLITVLYTATIIMIPDVMLGQSPDTWLINPDEVNHTNFISNFSGLLAPAILIGAAIHFQTQEALVLNREIYEEQQENFKYFNAHADNYLQFAPIAQGYLVHAVGYKAKDGLAQATWQLAKAEALMLAMVSTTKTITKSRRPDSGGVNSFPSGHTAQAFLAASFLHDQFGQHHPLISISGFATATLVGVMRVLNNRHWTSDVLAGAGYGMLSWQIVSLTHKGRFFKNNSNRLSVMPVSTGKNYIGVNAVYKF